MLQKLSKKNLEIKRKMDLWEIINLVVLDKGEEQLGSLSEYGMESALKKYEKGEFNLDAHDFYSKNFLYFSNYDSSRSLFENKQRFNKLIETGKIRL